MVGKVPPEALERLVFTRLGDSDPAVVQGPAYGEDTAALRVDAAGDEELLVINSDPISLAVDRVGTLGVTVACNDIAASGGTPRWLTNVCILPADGDRELDRITRQIDDAAAAVGAHVIGGHAEYSEELSRPLVSMTCLGTTDRYIPTSGASAGELIVIAGHAGTEGTAILGSDFRDELDEQVTEETFTAAEACYEDLSVQAAASALAPYATAMHDPTEGGVLAGLHEMATASSATFMVERTRIPVRPETETLCGVLNIDPVRIFGSGALLATVPQAERNAALRALEEKDLTAAVIGQVDTADETEAGVCLDAEPVVGPVEDALYDLWE
ncbi:AIR synthase-related protein [Halocatena pleomorpha]|uniref:Hydrogenase expression protein n=1 Tax=Halocatena pleomorpha TaxID=1785090 RepID=A0A3P3RCC6_9EURY|nr:AIR synthase-related protein [Halocatena pleomorpha]RRJ31035.1 hydrogenase expression protein [Halocatena pleomorpha]